MTKLGVHNLLPTADAMKLMEAGVRLVKIVDQLGMAKEIKEKYPDSTIIAMISTDIRLEDSSNPEALANKWFEDNRARIESAPGVDYFEGLNEPPVESLARMELLARFEHKRIELMASINRRCALCSFSVGNPPTDPAQWEKMIPVLKYGILHGAILAFHEYSWPTMRWMTGAYQTDPTDKSGFAPDGSLEGWTTLRYRKVERLFLKDISIPFVITEFGVDPGVRPLPFDGGGFFRNEGYRNGINQFEGSIQEPNAYYARDLMWYIREIEKDPYVMGATLFTLGHTGPWEDADVAETPVVDILIEYLTGKRQFVDYPPRIPELTGNLFDNPHFDKLVDGKGYYTWTDPEENNRITPEVNIPNGWSFWFQHDKVIRLPNQRPDGPFDPPEIVWWTKVQAKLSEQWSLFRRGAAIIKAFGGWKPIWFKFWQTKTLQAGADYKVTVRVFPDSVAEYDPHGNKVYATDPVSVEHRVIVDDDDSPWLDGHQVIIGQWNEFSRVFKANGKLQKIGFEVRGRYGLINNGWFFDEATLRPVIELPVEVPPVEPPVEPPKEPPVKFTLGQMVKVTSGVGLRVRSIPTLTGGTILGIQSQNSTGTVSDGPIAADGVNFWKINYELGEDGWSSEVYLELAPVPVPVPVNTGTLTEADVIFLQDKLRLATQTIQDVTNRLVDIVARG